MDYMKDYNNYYDRRGWRYDKLEVLKEKAEIVNDEKIIKKVTRKYIIPKIIYIIGGIVGSICFFIYMLFLVIINIKKYGIDIGIIFISIVTFLIEFLLIADINKDLKALKFHKLNKEPVKHYRSEVYESKVKVDNEHMITGKYGYSSPDTYHTIRLKDEIVLDVSFIEACKLDIKKELGKPPIVDVYFTDQMFEDYEFQIVIN